MTKKLFFEALLKVTLGILVVGILLFVSAGTLKYINGILLMAVLFVPMIITGTLMMIFSPELLKKRLNAKEKLSVQSTVIKLSGIMFVLGFITAGINFRFGLYMFPLNVSYIGLIIFIISYILYGEVIRENPYLSRTVEIQENHKLVDSGLYKYVRHPMYSVTLFLFLSIPLILGSLVSFIIFLAYPFLIAKRIKSEEEFLEKELSGYKEYKEKVKYRLIPFVW